MGYSAVRASKSDSSTCRVAICDDVPSFRQLLSAVFRWEQGFELVGEATNGAEAIELARRVQPDVMILDIAMPIMDGMEALPRIREAAPSTRVVVLTGFGSAGMQSRAMAAGATGFLEKGARPAAIIDAVRTAFEKRRPPHGSTTPSSAAAPDAE